MQMIVLKMIYLQLYCLIACDEELAQLIETSILWSVWLDSFSNECPLCRLLGLCTPLKGGC